MGECVDGGWFRNCPRVPRGPDGTAAVVVECVFCGRDVGIFFVAGVPGGRGRERGRGLWPLMFGGVHIGCCVAGLVLKKKDRLMTVVVVCRAVMGKGWV